MRRVDREAEMPAGPFELPNQQFNQDFVEREYSPIDQIDQIPNPTIDEGTGITVARQFANVCYKFYLVTFPQESEESTSKLRNWDLWGPFLIGLLFILIVDGGDNFQLVLTTLFGSTGILTFNVKVLGGKISYLQGLSVLGYCFFPQFVAVIFLEIIKLFGVKYLSVRVISATITCIWSILSARAFISVNIKPDRRFVAVLPIAIIYFYIGSHVVFY